MQTQAQFRLLVVRLGAMGDILHALPAVTALRRAHPAWKIDWAVEPRWRPLLSAEAENSALAGDGNGQRNGQPNSERPVVDSIHQVPARAWGKRAFSPRTWEEIGALRRDLRSAEYDAVLDLQGAIRSAVVARLSGCARIVGAAEPWEGPAKWLYSEQVETPRPHVIEQNFDLASAVAGDLLEATQADLPVSPEAEYWCDELPELKDAVWRGRPVVLLHPGAGWGAKRWPADRYGALAEELGQRGAVVLVNAAPGEEALARAVVESSGTEVPAHSVSCSLEQLIALTRRSALAIGGDTGPLHLACALGKPVVGIYGPTDPRRNGPFGTRFRVMRNPESRTDHARAEQPEAGLLTISPEAVMAATIEVMLEERQARRDQARSAFEREKPPAYTASGDPIGDSRRS